MVIIGQVDAELMLRERIALGESEFVELVVWRVPKALDGSEHAFKYRLAYVVDRQCVLRYDNEAGKGDHRHLRRQESAYRFTSVRQLLDDFWADVDQERSR